MGYYSGSFSCREDVEREFEEILPSSVEILVAIYDTGCYDGEAYVLFEEDGKLYEVNDSHCSCRGLEGGWKPEETTAESLRYILQRGNKFYSIGLDSEAIDVVRGVIDRYQKEPASV